MNCDFNEYSTKLVEFSQNRLRRDRLPMSRYRQFNCTGAVLNRLAHLVGEWIDH